jgi:hypothetical protein
MAREPNWVSCAEDSTVYGHTCGPGVGTYKQEQEEVQLLKA